MLLVTGEDVPTTETSLLARSLLVEFNGKKDMKTFRDCLNRQDGYRKIPALYIAWLQKQDREVWKDQIRQYVDSFTTLIDSHDLNTDNSRRLASNAALSAVGLHAFLEFAQNIDAVDEEYAHTLRADHWKILCAILEKMLLEVNEIKPGNIFISVLEELIHAKRVKILENYAEYHTDRSTPVIGYYRNNKETLCLFPKTTMAIVRDTFRRSEDETLNFSTTAIGKQLIEEGYIVKPEGKSLTFLERIPGAGRERQPSRVWKFHAHKIKGMGDDL
jgi:hypothetical protein